MSLVFFKHRHAVRRAAAGQEKSDSRAWCESLFVVFYAE
jgi:hypothetical protein